MNREWSDKNKLAQSKLKKATFYDGINEFLKLREMLMQEMLSWKKLLSYIQRKCSYISILKYAAKLTC